MKKNTSSGFSIIPFFAYHQTNDAGEKEFVCMSRAIKARGNELERIQKLVPVEGRKLPTLRDGQRCLVMFLGSRKEIIPDVFREDGQPQKRKIEGYEFVVALPEIAEFRWDDRHDCWSYLINVGSVTVVYRVRNQDIRRLPKGQAPCTVKWTVKPFHVGYVSPAQDFFLISVQLVEEKTSVHSVRRQIKNGYREEWSPGNDIKVLPDIEADESDDPETNGGAGGIVALEEIWPVKSEPADEAETETGIEDEKEDDVKVASA